MPVTAEDLASARVPDAAAKFLRMTRRTLERKEREGKIKALRPTGPGGRVYYTERELLNYINTYGVERTPRRKTA